MNADGSNRRVITASLDRPMAGIIWALDNIGVYFNTESEGSKNLYFATLSGQVRPITVGKQVLTVTDVGRNGVAVGVRSTPTEPNDVVTFTVPKTGTTSTFAQVTWANKD